MFPQRSFLIRGVRRGQDFGSENGRVGVKENLAGVRTIMGQIFARIAIGAEISAGSTNIGGLKFGFHAILVGFDQSAIDIEDVRDVVTL